MRYSKSEAFVRVLLSRIFSKLRIKGSQRVWVGVMEVEIGNTIEISLPSAKEKISLSDMVEAVRKISWDSDADFSDARGRVPRYQIDIDRMGDLAVVRAGPNLFEIPLLRATQVLLVPFSDPLGLINQEVFLPPYYDHNLGNQEKVFDLINYFKNQRVSQHTILDKPELPCIFCGAATHLSEACPNLEQLSGEPVEQQGQTGAGLGDLLARIPKPVRWVLIGLVLLLLIGGPVAWFAMNGKLLPDQTSPLATAPAEEDQDLTIPSIIAREEWDPQYADLSPAYEPLDPEYITLIHSGSPYPTQPVPDFLQDLIAWETGTTLNYVDLDAHFFVDREGNIYAGRPLDAQGQIGFFDEQGHILIHAIGNYTDEMPSPEMIDAMATLIVWLCDTYQIPLENVRGASQINPASPSPGANLEEALQPEGDLYTQLADLLAE